MTAPEISVVLPVYRNRDALDSLYARLVAALAPLAARFELVFVDDCCPDRSLDVLRSIEGRDSRVRVVALPVRGGQMAALRAGLAAARGQKVVTMDADLQDPPEAIPLLLARLTPGVGAVYARRRGRYEPTLRLLTSRVFKTTVGLLTGMPPGAGSFVVMRREVTYRVLALPDAAPYLTGAVSWAARLAGLSVTFVPVVRQPRADGGSSYSGAMRISMGARAIGQALRWRVAGASPSGVRTTAAIALGLLAMLSATTHGDIGWDGAWMLQVIDRLASGAVLYRDVFCGVPPLAVYTGRAATALFGVELFALRLLVSAVVALSYLAAADLLARLTGTRRYDLVLAPLMFLLAVPANVPLYQPLANLFLLVAVGMVTRGTSSSAQALQPDPRWLFVSGTAAGLSFAAKPTIGLLALASVLLITGFAALRRGAVPVARLAGSWLATMVGFSAGVVVLLIPVALSGGWSHFLDYVFLNKGTYLRVAGVGYLGEAWSFVVRLVAGGEPSVLGAVKNLPLIVPVLAVPALWMTLREERRQPASAFTVTILALAELATLFPRGDVDHVVPGVPGFLVVILFGWSAVRRRRASWKTELAVVAFVAALCGVRVGASGLALVSSSRTWSSMPHLRGVRITRDREEVLARNAAALRGAAYKGQLFLLVPNAGLYYLVSGVGNPTPFDYPLETAFGRRGESLLALGVEMGLLTRVCLAPVSGTMAPERLQRVVQDRLQRDADLGVCTLYRRGSE